MDELNVLKIDGVISNIIFKNEDNGYCVAAAQLIDGGEVVIVGTMPFLGESETISAVGNFINHPEYGSQFAISSYERTLPADLNGICTYLSSKTIKGIGPKTARQIVDLFGKDSFDVIANQPEKLCKIRGISLEKARDISASFAKQNIMRMVLEFLIRYHLPLYHGAGIYQSYGENSINILHSNPYVLCDEKYGLGFNTVDDIARELEILDESPVRIRAALLYELSFNLQSGHVFIPRDKLLEITNRLCGVSTELIEHELAELCELGDIVSDIVAEREMCYLSEYYKFESSIAGEIHRLAEMHLMCPPDFEKVFKKIQKDLNIEYAEKQAAALRAPFEYGICVITGGPGTGKTTAIQGLIKLFEHYKMDVLMAAPTGRAAKRITELCGVEAKTIHRLLEAKFSKDEGTMFFNRNNQNPLDTDVLIVDESSMIDMKLASSIFNALKPHTRIVFVGDKDQLPPVGAGTFFSDLVSSKHINSTILSYIFRQAGGSDIVSCAHMINAGEIPQLQKNTNDFFFSSASFSKFAIDTIVSLITQRIPKTFGIEKQDIQLITPTRQMSCGTVSLNNVLQDALNPPAAGKSEVRFGPVIFRDGDRVMQTRNNYDVLWVKPQTGEAGTGIFNGDCGNITHIDKKQGVLTINFEDRDADYSFDELGQIEHAYAITAHKAQGSEYEAVILPLFDVPERLQNRSILYTAVTRAKKLLIIVGKQDIVANMIASNNKNRRYGALKHRIRWEFEND